MHDTDWNPTSWRAYPALQQPEYPDSQHLEAVLKTIRSYPPLVSPGEVDKLKQHIAEAGAGKRFILQGGDCAERFIDCNARSITNKIKILLQMSVILTHGLRMPVVRIGRIAGQYAKPRSSPVELRDGREIPSYRGDSVNAFAPATPEARTPDPNRLLKSFYLSAVTLNHIRAMIDGGFADLHNPFTWNLHSVEQTKKWADYEQIVERILDAISFMEVFGGVDSEKLGKIEFFTSHEGLLLGYEEALTRKDPESGSFYNLGAHMVWLGDRTRDLNMAHVEYFRGIANPIAVKIGPDCQKTELHDLLRVLNPEEEPGRITLITRFGAENVERCLPPIIDMVRKNGHVLTWLCDPMHGNTTTVSKSIKTRNFEHILQELHSTFSIHRTIGTIMAGAHFELTGEDVTECVGGAIELTHDDLGRNYESYCDPRLNYAQSLEMVFSITQMFRNAG